MKHRLFYFTFLTALGFANMAKAQTAECASQFWGSQTPYSYTPVEDNMPDEYTPVFINYVGRNAASHLHADIATMYISALLQKGDSAHALKPEAARLSKMLTILQTIEKGKLNNITLSGADEMHDIGARMLANYRTVFHRGCVKVSAIKENVMTQSAAAMLEGLTHKLDDPDCEKTDYKDDDNLSPQLASKALATFYEKGDWKDDAENLRENKRPKNFNEHFLKRFFSDDFFDSIDETAQNKFIDDMYSLGQLTGSIGAEIIKAGYTLDQVNIRKYFTCDELELFSRMSAANYYYKAGPGYDKQGLQVKAALPLLINFINTTDAYSLSKTVGLDMRIATPEVISSFAAIMNFKEVSKPSTDVNKFDRNWSVEHVLPWAANIQWILYQGTTADTRTTYLIKFMLNEQPMEIEGLKTATAGEYYKWDDVKEFFLKKMADEWDAEKFNDNMHTYLMNLKP